MAEAPSVAVKRQADYKVCGTCRCSVSRNAFCDLITAKSDNALYDGRAHARETMLHKPVINVSREPPWRSLRLQ